VTDGRRDLLQAVLGFLNLEPRESEFRLLHRCFDTWRGLGTSWRGWRARSTTSIYAATTVGAGARPPLAEQASWLVALSELDLAVPEPNL